MAKYYGIGGKRTGSVGNETYTIVKGENIVKGKIIHINDAKTPEQIEQRSKLQNAVKAYKQIGPDFLRKCFEFKKQRQSTYNAFVSANTKLAKPFFKKFSDDANIIGLGNIRMSDGSLPKLPVATSGNIVLNEITYTFYGIKVSNDLSADSTVAQVSTYLINAYHLAEGMFINGIGIYNDGVQFNAASSENPLTLADQYMVSKDKQNFALNKSDNTVITEKGFTIVGAEDNKHLVLLEEYSAETPSIACAKTTSVGGQCLGYCAYFVSQKNGSRIKVSSSYVNVNAALAALFNKIEENPLRINGWLATAMKILIITSYGIKKVIEIIRDWPI